MSFHLGKPILVMMLIALLSGAVVAFRPAQRKADMTMWVFADSHYTTFKPLIPEFEKRHGVTVNMNLLNGQALAMRLGQLFMADIYSERAPDVLEMEIGLVGRFFRPPIDEVGFLPLNDRLKQSGDYDKVVETRFAPWTKEGVIFGVPHDVHPCAILYRHDLFWGAQLPDGTFNGPGPRIDLPACKTWPEFHAACVKFEEYWKSKGVRHRHALELPEASSEYLQAMLLQRGVNLVDSYGKIHLEDPRVAQTLAFYATLVAGDRKVTAQTPSGFGALTKDLAEGNICAFIAPDWRVTQIKMYGAAVSGKMRLMPLPVFDPTDYPTTTHGGTMMGITRACKNPDLAWKLVEFLYFSDEGIRARLATTDILPPIKAAWAAPVYHKPDPFFGGQVSGEVFVDLAGKIPPRYVSPLSGIITFSLNDAVIRATNHVERHGTDGLEAACQKWLADIATDIRARMKQWRFDE